MSPYRLGSSNLQLSTLALPSAGIKGCTVTPSSAHELLKKKDGLYGGHSKLHLFNSHFVSRTVVSMLMPALGKYFYLSLFSVIADIDEPP